MLSCLMNGHGQASNITCDAPDATKEQLKIMSKFNRVAVMWLLVLILQLLKAPIASSSSCRYKGHKEVISVQGGYNCKQTRVELGMCVGTCKSYAIPVPAEDDGNDPRFQTVCECCAPKELVASEDRLVCPEDDLPTFYPSVERVHLDDPN
ncbi:unnamed protein product [Porites evermanni]|uniref:DAN domain-containing protein n=1 Tax=Porites evermanni TaxID=104178 RepID=A0ABN8M233_9CNID|nr:unnamed protein product [Porites evermanni]